MFSREHIQNNPASRTCKALAITKEDLEVKNMKYKNQQAIDELREKFEKRFNLNRDLEKEAGEWFLEDIDCNNAWQFFETNLDEQLSKKEEEVIGKLTTFMKGLTKDLENMTANDVHELITFQLERMSRTKK